MPKKLSRLLPALFWILIWQLLSILVGHRLLLASPLETLLRLAELTCTRKFWLSVLFTLGHILAGFIAALITGTLTGALSARFAGLKTLLAPLLTVIKSVPVASFVIVALIWIPSRRLSVLISFLIAFPLIHAAIMDGLTHIDPKLLEMAQVFQISPVYQLLSIDLPAVLPRLTSAASIAIGLAWKSGVAAEVIGIPTGSVGERLYQAKVYLATPDLFAWTLTIVLASMLCERMLRFLLHKAECLLERM